MGDADRRTENGETGTSCEELRIFDLGPYLDGDETEGTAALCRDVAASLKQSGVLVVVDPRVDSRANSEFIDVMEAYFGQVRFARWLFCSVCVSSTCGGRCVCCMGW